MKRFLTKIVSLIVILAFAVGCMASCSLISVNTVRDMDQVIATVKVSDSVDEDKIYKKDLVSAYSSYGYYYTQYYGYSVNDTYEMLIDNLIQNRIVVQQAKVALVEEYNGAEEGFFKLAASVDASSRTDIEKILTEARFDPDTNLTAKSDPVHFVTEYEYYYSYYNVYSTILSTIESLMDEEEEEEDAEYETYTISEPRTTLTSDDDEDGNQEELKSMTFTVDYSNSLKKILKELELEDSVINTALNADNKYDLNLQVYKAYVDNFSDYIFSSKLRTAALKKALRRLNNNGYINDEEKSEDFVNAEGNYDINEIFNISLFKNELDSELESRIVEEFELALENKARKTIDLSKDALYNEFVELFNYQKEQYSSDITAYETAVSDVTGETFVLYNPDLTSTVGTYGYIANLLISFSDEASALYSDYKADGKLTDEAIYAKRTELAASIKAIDQRADWVYSNYGYIEVSTDNGTTWVKNTDATINTSYKYRFVFDEKYVKNEELTVFEGEIDASAIRTYTYTDDNDEEQIGYLFDDVVASEESFADFKERVLKNVLGFDTSLDSGNVTNYDEIADLFLDVIYAYSQDSGSLSEDYGYLYSPLTSASTYVTEFAEAAKRVVEEGVGAWEICLTDYGYHIIICTKVVNEFKDSATDYYENSTAFAADFANEDSLAARFMNYKLDLYIDTDVSNEGTSFINKIKDDTSKVQKYESRYEDLLEDE